MSDIDRPRRIVKIAAGIKNSASDWFFRDEKGLWEKNARELWEKTTANRAELGMSDAEAEEQIALHLSLLALTAMANDAKKSSSKRSAK
jgi:hypothetical protein